MELLPMWVDGLTPEIRNKAKVELGETPETQKDAILKLRTLINEEENFNCPEDDKFLIKFLRAKKYDVKRAFVMLQNYYAYKKKFPALLTNTDIAVSKTNSFFLPPVRSPDGSFIAIVSVGQFDFEKFSIDDYFHTASICVEQAMELDTSQVCGISAIFDYKDITLNKLRHFSSPSFFSMVIKGMENCWPFRVRSIHLVNEPFYISILVNIIWPMLSKKIRNRFFFHGSNLSSLQKTFPKACLPKQLGGSLEQKAFEQFREILISRQMETERSQKYSYHRVQKGTRRHSACGMEENSICQQPVPGVDTCSACS